MCREEGEICISKSRKAGGKVRALLLLRHLFSPTLANFNSLRYIYIHTVRLYALYAEASNYNSDKLLLPFTPNSR